MQIFTVFDKRGRTDKFWMRFSNTIHNCCLFLEETDDENEDTEYNFMAEDHKEEQEEYRNDRAVRIPRECCDNE